MAEPHSWELIVIDALTALAVYTDDDLERLGYERSAYGQEKFNRERVVVTFRVSFRDQAFPLRIQFLKDEAPEDQWIGHAREKASRLIHELAAVLPP